MAGGGVGGPLDAPTPSGGERARGGGWIGLACGSEVDGKTGKATGKTVTKGETSVSITGGPSFFIAKTCEGHAGPPSGPVDHHPTSWGGCPMWARGARTRRFEVEGLERREAPVGIILATPAALP